MRENENEPHGIISKFRAGAFADKDEISCELGGYHLNRPSFTIIVDPIFATEQRDYSNFPKRGYTHYVEFPVPNSALRLCKGTPRLVKCEGCRTEYVKIEAGLGGISNFDFLPGCIGYTVLPFDEWKGNSFSKGAIFTVPSGYAVSLEWHRSGKLGRLPMKGVLRLEPIEKEEVTDVQTN